MMTPSELQAMLEYDPKSGEMYWRARPLSSFKSERYGAYWNDRYAGSRAFSSARPDGYSQRQIGGVRIYAHRAAWAIVHGQWPQGDIDHINGDKSDNRLSNLRVVSRAENQRNRSLPKDNRSGVIGVSWDAQRCKWVASIRDGGKKVSLGRFECIGAAAASRAIAAAQSGYHENHGRPQ